MGKPITVAVHWAVCFTAVTFRSELRALVSGLDEVKCHGKGKNVKGYLVVAL